MWQYAFGVSRLLVLESSYCLLAERDLSGEQFWVVFDGSQMKDRLVEKHFVVFVPLMQFLAHIRMQSFQGKSSQLPMVNSTAFGLAPQRLYFID